MDKFKLKEVMMDRAASVRDNMSRAVRSGSDCHEMDNIHHAAGLAVELLQSCPQADLEAFAPVVARLEKRCVDLFTRRYGGLSK